MREKAILSCLVCLLTTVLLAQTQKTEKEQAPPAAGNVKPALIPLNAKTGLWQMTETVRWTGLPPQLAAAMNSGRPVNYKSCVSTENLSSNPWAEGSGEKCRWTPLTSNGTDMELQTESCQLGKEYGMTATAHGKIHVADPTDGTGSFDITLTGNGQTMQGHADYAGKWIGATCPASIK